MNITEVFKTALCYLVQESVMSISVLPAAMVCLTSCDCIDSQKL